LVSAARALGATRWQTAARLVVPAASPGLFAAVMLGLGRAVGETMIVLMAAGNTPLLDLSPFNGMRTMSAAIAVEIPEAPVGGTLFRVLFLTGTLSSAHLCSHRRGPHRRRLCSVCPFLTPRSRYRTSAPAPGLSTPLATAVLLLCPPCPGARSTRHLVLYSLRSAREEPPSGDPARERSQAAAVAWQPATASFEAHDFVWSRGVARRSAPDLVGQRREYGDAFGRICRPCRRRAIDPARGLAAARGGAAARGATHAGPGARPSAEEPGR
jgi:hypothetical protein